MADYKDMLFGTLSSLAETLTTKAKEVAESDTVRGVYEKSAGKAKSYARIAKLSIMVNGENEELKKIYTEIGKLCYEQEKDNAGEFYAVLFEQVKELEADMQANKDEIEALKAELAAAAEEAPAEEIVADADDFESVVAAAEENAVPAEPAEEEKPAE